MTLTIPLKRCFLTYVRSLPTWMQEVDITQLPGWTSCTSRGCFGSEMAEDNTLPLRVSEIKDPAVLFERYDTEQIRRVERKVRGEIEQKKEELRQMVGERYRDLIDAADTIREMRQCSESVVQSVQDMQQYCQRLKQGKSGLPSSRLEVTFSNNYCGDKLRFKAKRSTTF